MQFEILPNWHPIFVHFSLSLYVIATVLFVAGRMRLFSRQSKFFTRAAHLNLILGGLITIGTVSAGFYAYYTVAHDAPSHRAMTDHRNWAIGAAIVWWLLVIVSLRAVRDGVANRLFVGCLAVAVGLLMIAGYKGGEAVYRYGLGVLSLPAVEGDGGHGSHSHGEGMDHGAASPMPTSEHGGHAEGMENTSSPSDDGDGHSHQH